jgi:site-specific recombinase XerC
VRFRNNTLRHVDEGTWRPEPKALSVRQLLEDWLASKASENVRPATQALYRRATDAWIDPYVGDLNVRQLTPARMCELIKLLSESGSTQGRGGLGPRSVQLTVTVLKAATSWSVKTGLLRRDPLVGFKRPRAESKAMTSWSIEEAKAFLNVAVDDRLACIWALAITRGLRRGEL